MKLSSQDIQTMQLSINFDGGLTDQFPEWRDMVKASVYGCGRQLKAIAADLDMSSSELSRKLADNPNDPVHFPLDRLPDLVKATGDNKPIYWLMEKFLETKEDRYNRVMSIVEESSANLSRALAKLDKLQPRAA